VNATPLPLVCFTREGLVPSILLAALREQQVAWMSEAVLGGVPVMRACITSFRTTEQDIHWVVERMNSLFSESSVAESSVAESVGGKNCEPASTTIKTRDTAIETGTGL
jgi:hypothetical protein